MPLKSFALINYGAEQMPRRMHPEDAGMDVFAPYDIVITPGKTQCIPLGFGMTMPAGYMAYTTARGSTAVRGLYVAENPIDSNYIGEAHATVTCFNYEPVTIKKGERFCQLVVVPCICGAASHMHNSPPSWPVIMPADTQQTDRDVGAYGSTDAPKEPKPKDPLDKASEVITLKVIGKPTPLSFPFARKQSLNDIACTFDPDNHTVTIRNYADIVTLGIVVKVLQNQYIDACKNYSVDIRRQIDKVIEEVCNSGQN